MKITLLLFWVFVIFHTTCCCSEPCPTTDQCEKKNNFLINSEKFLSNQSWREGSLQLHVVWNITKTQNKGSVYFESMILELTNNLHINNFFYWFLNRVCNFSHVTSNLCVCSGLHCPLQFENDEQQTEKASMTQYVNYIYLDL